MFIKKAKKRKRKKLMKEDIPKETVQDVYRKAAKRTVQTRRVKRKKNKKNKKIKKKSKRQSIKKNFLRYSVSITIEVYLYFLTQIVLKIFLP